MPHFHAHLALHRPDDALNVQLIRGEILEEKLESGVTRFSSRDFPALPEEQQRAVAEHVKRRLKLESLRPS